MMTSLEKNARFSSCISYGVNRLFTLIEALFRAVVESYKFTSGFIKTLTLDPTLLLLNRMK